MLKNTGRRTSPTTLSGLLRTFSSDRKGKRMNPITHYTVIASETPLVFEDTINEYLANGWELYGNPFVIRGEYGRDAYAQALVQRKNVTQWPITT